MKNKLVAQSISRSVWETLAQAPFAAQILGVFSQACNLVTPDGRIVTLVLPAVGNGPLNVVLEYELGAFANLAPGDPAELRGESLHVGALEIALKNATIWEPCPNWADLSTYQETIGLHFPSVRDVALNQAPAGTLLSLIDESFHGSDPLKTPHSSFDKTVSLARIGAHTLLQGWDDDPDQLHDAGARLAGLGNGLTPAGDDFLAGVMLWAWLAHPMPQQLCSVLVEAAAPRTTTLSAAFLRAAGRGECNMPWHGLLTALAQEKLDTIASATHKVLAFGASSGADTLAGFLWMWSNQKAPQMR